MTTDLEKIREVLQADRPEALTVVFCTRQSLALVATVLAEGAPAFDLMECDEAHRTTGVEESPDKRKVDQKVSPCRLVHDKDSIHAYKRLYATATSRLYADSAKGKAAKSKVGIYSMDDESVYGPVFYSMKLSEAIEGGWLTDYKATILALKSQRGADALGNQLATK